MKSEPIFLSLEDTLVIHERMIREFGGDPGLREMGLLEALTGKHWEIIYFMRHSFKETGVVPTVYETCDANNLEIEELEKLFPHGYHRGAVKMAGLRVR